jgi:mRNA-degrading endonuclease toxin of MazEF toxin-antitoxin module
MGPHPFELGASSRPWPVVSNDSRPFHGDSYLVVTVTTTERSAAVPLRSHHWTDGGAPRQSYAALWTVIQLAHHSIRSPEGYETGEYVGHLRRGLVDSVVAQTASYLEAS